jgi:hypothetical protein
MFNRQAVLVVALTAGIVITSGALAMLSASGPAHGPTPAQIDAFDLMSKAPVLPEQKIDDLF